MATSDRAHYCTLRGTFAAFPFFAAEEADDATNRGNDKYDD